MVGVVKKLALKASARIAKYEARKHSKQSPKDAFKASWDRLLSRRLYRLCIRMAVKEDTQLKGRTFELLAAKIPGFYGSSRIEICGPLKEAIDRQEPLLTVHIHEGHRFLSRAIAERGREQTRIVDNPSGFLRRLRVMGIDASRIHAVKGDILSLAHLRKAIRDNHVLGCAIDYPDATGRKAYINPAVFSFANHHRIPVYFFKAHINQSGHAQLISAGPYIDVDPMTCARDFIDFFNSVGESRITMKIKRYREHLDWKNTRSEPGKAESRLPSLLN